jgi:hypothetical protein
MKSLLAVLAPFRKPLVVAALGGFLAGVTALWTARGLTGCGWRPLGVARTFTDDEVLAGRRNARIATQVLSSFLGDGDRGRGWRSYLRMDELQAELGDGDYPPPPTRSDPNLLPDVVQKLSQPYPGLELKEFTGLRSALSAYVKMLDMSGPLPEVAPPPPDAYMATSQYRRYR